MEEVEPDLQNKAAACKQRVVLGAMTLLQQVSASRGHCVDPFTHTDNKSPPPLIDQYRGLEICTAKTTSMVLNNWS